MKQWDKHLPAVLWAYCNTPHDTTGEKPSLLLFGWDCKSPSEAAMLSPDGAQPTAVADYRQELIESLSTVRQTALHSISRSQKKYKKQYDSKSDSYQLCVGDWILICYPSEEIGRLKKLSRPWHGPYRITACDNTDVSAVSLFLSGRRR